MCGNEARVILRERERPTRGPQALRLREQRVACAAPAPAPAVEPRGTARGSVGSEPSRRLFVEMGDPRTHQQEGEEKTRGELGRPPPVHRSEPSGAQLQRCAATTATHEKKSVSLSLSRARAVCERERETRKNGLVSCTTKKAKFDGVAPSQARRDLGRAAAESRGAARASWRKPRAQALFAGVLTGRGVRGERVGAALGRGLLQGRLRTCPRVFWDSAVRRLRVCTETSLRGCRACSTESVLPRTSEVRTLSLSRVSLSRERESDLIDCNNKNIPAFPFWARL